MTEKEIIPIDSKSFIPVEEIKVNSVKDESNELLFINGTIDIVPFNGMKKGPYKGSDYSKIQFFYIFHEGHKLIAQTLHEYFTNGIASFKGLYKFVRVPYNTVGNFSIIFKNKDNPLPEIERELIKREFKQDVQ